MTETIRIELELSRRQLRAALTLSCILGGAYALHSESLTVTSYYPSPSGIYRKLIAKSDVRLATDGGLVEVGTARSSPPARLLVNGSARFKAQADFDGPANFRGFDVNLNGMRAVGSARPSDPGDLANKQYVDEQAESLRASIRTLETRLAQAEDKPKGGELASSDCYAVKAARESAPGCAAGFYLKGLVKSTDKNWDGYGAFCCNAAAVPAVPGHASYDALAAACKANRGSFGAHDVTCPH